MTSARLPDFLIVGAMRSGTTSLYRYLTAHPDVCPATSKELHFFDDHWSQGLDWYAQQFPARGAQQRSGEATQSYMYDPVAWKRLVDTVPESRLIIVLRNPVDRAYSHYWHTKARGDEPLSFVDAIDAEPKRLADGNIYTARRFGYLSRGEYAPQVSRVFESFPRDRVAIIQFEIMRDDSAGVIRNCYEFVGVDSSFVPDNVGESVNRYVAYRSATVRNWGKRLPGPVRKVVGRLNQVDAGYEPMPSEVRARLADHFAESNRELVALVSTIDLTRWR